MENQLDLDTGGLRIGYARVSTNEQNLNLQTDILKKAGCTTIYTENISGSKKQRPELEYCLKALRSGDTLVVYRLDRLGRSLVHLINLVNSLKEKNIKLESISENINTNTAIGQMCFQFFGMLAEFERNLIRERTFDGLASARARGRKGGRKPKLTSSQIKEIQILADSRQYTITDIAKKFGISRPTLYSLLKN